MTRPTNGGGDGLAQALNSKHKELRNVALDIIARYSNLPAREAANELGVSLATYFRLKRDYNLLVKPML